MNDDEAPAALWRGSARDTRDEARRRQLLDAALELYGTRGYHTTTVQAVCRLAAVSSRSFYELYSHQEQLLAQLYRELNDEVLAGMSSVRLDADDDVAAFVHSMVSGALDPMLRDQRKARVLEVESVGVSEEFERHRRAAYRTFARAIDQAFAVLADAGLIREAPPGLASLVLVGGITEALMQRVQSPEPEPEPAAKEAFIKQISAVVLQLLA